jgi:hypothetical protein
VIVYKLIIRRLLLKLTIIRFIRFRPTTTFNRPDPPLPAISEVLHSTVLRGPKMKELFTYQFFKRNYRLHPRPLQQQNAHLASPSIFNATWQGIIGINRVRPAANIFTQESDHLKTVIRYAEFKNTFNRLGDGNDATSR